MNTPNNAGKEHNPDGLTPEQVGEGWRLLTKNEVITEGDEWWNGAKWKQTLVTKPEALTPSGNTYRRRTTLPTQSKPCNYCEGAGRVETAPCVSDVCPVCKGERYCTTPPTQSQEGEPFDGQPEKQAMYWRERYEIEHDELLIAQRENDRLRAHVKRLIEEAKNYVANCPADQDTTANFYAAGVNLQTAIHEAEYDTARAATEEGKRG